MYMYVIDLYMTLTIKVKLLILTKIAIMSVADWHIWQSQNFYFTMFDLGLHMDVYFVFGCEEYVLVSWNVVYLN